MYKINYEVDNGMAFTIINEKIKGRLNVNDTQVLMEHFKNLNEKSKYVETGSYLGCSAILAALSSNNVSTIYCHDLWLENPTDLPIESGKPPEVDDYFYVFYNNVSELNLEKTIIPMRGNSHYTLGIHKDKSIDLAFIDGDHSYDGCYKDLEKIFPKMKDDGIILCHDCRDDSDVLRAVTDFSNNNGFKHLDGFVGSSIMRINMKQVHRQNCNTSSNPS